MTELVVDSSVVVKLLFDEVESSLARQIIGHAVKNRIDLIAPASITAEVGNALWTRFHRGVASPQEVRDGLETFGELAVVTFDLEALLDDAMGLALKYDQSFYDSLFVALSVRQQCPLVTADQKLINAVSEHIPNVRSLKNFEFLSP